MTLAPRTATCDGYNLNAGVSVAATDREGLERLCRYILRPPLAKGRLERLDDGSVRVGFKRAWSDGTTAIVLSPAEFVERLAALVPPARSHQVLYRGVLAPHAALRKEVVPRPPRERSPSPKLTKQPAVKIVSERLSWADLLRRVFAVDAFACPACGGRLELRCVVQGRAVEKVLAGLHATVPP